MLLVRDDGIRDGVGGVQVYMVQRPGRGVDFPDLHVFPGGKVDDADADVAATGLPHPVANRLLGVTSGALAYWVAAIRECFEEAGVLLCYGSAAPLAESSPDASGPRQVLARSAAEQLAEYRQVLVDGELTMAEFCSAHNLLPALDRLVYFSHWITPEAAPRRFDTRFFITAMPDMQDTDRDTWETASSEWITPEEALAKHERGDWQMIMPTLTTLRSIVGYDNVAALLDAVLKEEHLPTLTNHLRAEGMQDLR